MNSWQGLLRVLLATGINVAFVVHQSFAQSRQAHPLKTELDLLNPLIPAGYGKRKLSDFEIYRLKKEINKLDQAAKMEFKLGNSNRAFELWDQQLKIAQAISLEVEIETLGKVGAIAWQENRAFDLRNIANRLIAIDKHKTQGDLSPQLLKSLATAYQQVRYLEQAIAIEEQILSQSKAKHDLEAIRKNLETIGKLHLAKFDYRKASKIYQELLTLAQAKSNSKQVNSYLTTLIDLYDRTEQTKLAIATRKDLIANYQQSKKLEPVAKLELSLAHDYETLKQTSKAREAYHQAFTLASATQQLAIASDALDSLAKLYLQEKQDQKAIATFTQLVTIQTQSDNYYGLINTYDHLGKISLKSAQKQAAKQYFQQALELAKTLDYQVEYFNQQIAKLP